METTEGFVPSLKSALFPLSNFQLFLFFCLFMGPFCGIKQNLVTNQKSTNDRQGTIDSDYFSFYDILSKGILKGEVSLYC
jgi:hypothetical protein